MAYTAMAYAGVADYSDGLQGSVQRCRFYIVRAYVIMAYAGMADYCYGLQQHCRVLANEGVYIVMAYLVMAYTVMADYSYGRL